MVACFGGDVELEVSGKGRGELAEGFTDNALKAIAIMCFSIAARHSDPELGVGRFAVLAVLHAQFATREAAPLFHEPQKMGVSA